MFGLFKNHITRIIVLARIVSAYIVTIIVKKCNIISFECRIPAMIYLYPLLPKIIISLVSSTGMYLRPSAPSKNKVLSLRLSSQIVLNKRIFMLRLLMPNTIPGKHIFAQYLLRSAGGGIGFAECSFCLYSSLQFFFIIFCQLYWFNFLLFRKAQFPTGYYSFLFQIIKIK